GIARVISCSYLISRKRRESMTFSRSVALSVAFCADVSQNQRENPVMTNVSVEFRGGLHYYRRPDSAHATPNAGGDRPTLVRAWVSRGARPACVQRSQ